MWEWYWEQQHKFFSVLPGQMSQITDCWVQILVFLELRFIVGKDLSLDNMPEHSSWPKLILEGV